MAEVMAGAMEEVMEEVAMVVAAMAGAMEEVAMVAAAMAGATGKLKEKVSEEETM